MSARRIKLKTSIAAQDALSLAADSKRETVRVDRQTIANLLIDHGVMCAAIGESHLEVPD
jgi:hypothetical protein